MSKQPWVNKQVQREICELAITYPMMAHQQIRQLVQEAFTGTDLYVPGDEYIRKAVSRFRKLHDDQDGAWSIGAFPSLISPDALKDVLSVWRWTLLVDVGFTVRQAKWVARLRFVVTRSDEEGVDEPNAEALYGWATLYSARERASESLEMTLETTDLDASLRIEDGAYWALVDTGRVRRLQWKELFLSAHEIAPNWVARVIRQLEDSEAQAPVIEETSELSDIERAVVAGWKQFRSLEDSVAKTQYHDAIAVWILWNKSLDRSKPWQTMTPERRLNTRLALRQEVADYYQSRADDEDSEGPHFMPSRELWSDLWRDIGVWDD